MWIILLLQLSLSIASEKYNVCGITINSDEEIKSFKKHLNPKDFNFVELTDVIDPAAIQKKEVPNDWFDAVCEKDIRCDVLVISGHFGGSFFGDKGIGLSLDALEKYSCNGKCKNILNSAKEVFLMGCNTLATKDSDHRTPEQYLQVLLDDDIDRAQAERIVQARYGALGDSFKDRMQRVFENVPNIYGFTSVGPSGKTVKPFLDKYFNKVGDYKEHILKIQTQDIVNLIEGANKAVKKFNNPVLAEVMATTAHAECAGITSSDPAYRIKKDICKFYDNNISQEDKVGLAEALLTTDDALLYIPTISSYFSTYQSDAVKKLKNNKKIEALLIKVAEDVKGSPATYIDIISLQEKIGYISEKKFLAEVKQVLLPYVKKMDRESADLLCSVEDMDSLYERYEKIAFKASDMNLSKLGTRDGVGTLGCINVAGESKQEVSSKLVSYMGQKRADPEYEAEYYYILGKNITAADFKIAEPQMIKTFSAQKNLEYKMALQISLATAYERSKDMKGLEELYKTGDLYAGNDWDSRQIILEAASHLEERSEVFVKIAMDKTRSNLNNTDLYGAAQMVGIFKTDQDIESLKQIISTQNTNSINSYFSVISDKSAVSPKVMDIYVNTVLGSHEADWVSINEVIASKLTREQKDKLLQFATEHPGHTAAYSIKEHCK